MALSEKIAGNRFTLVGMFPTQVSQLLCLPWACPRRLPTQVPNYCVSLAPVYPSPHTSVSLAPVHDVSPHKCLPCTCSRRLPTQVSQLLCLPYACSRRLYTHSPLQPALDALLSGEFHESVSTIFYSDNEEEAVEPVRVFIPAAAAIPKKQATHSEDVKMKWVGQCRVLVDDEICKCWSYVKEKMSNHCSVLNFNVPWSWVIIKNILSSRDNSLSWLRVHNLTYTSRYLLVTCCNLAVGFVMILFCIQ